MSTVACPQCGHPAPTGTKFCSECGTRLALVCAGCGTQLAAGAKFCSECGRPTAGDGAAAARGGAGTGAAPSTLFASPETYTPRRLAERILTSRVSLEGERKQVTVLFADLKGSMEFLADRDPEEARRILDGVLERMMEAVHRYDGTVNQVMGDGIMALFGAPVAHEDHAVRASYAALRMQATVAEYAAAMQRSAGLVIQIRVGLNSGDVLVRSIGSDLRMDYTAVGATTHLAARMEQTARPGSILATAETLRLAEDFIQVKPLGLVNVKGLSEPIEAFEITGAGVVRTRLQRSAARGLSRFVGRQEELEQLRQALDLAGTGRGQIVAIVGEPGVGKSRLFYEFLNSHRTKGWLILQASSVSYGRATAYLPVIDMLRPYFRLDDGDDARAVRSKVTGTVLTLDESLKDSLPPILGLLDALPADSAFLQLAPPQRRQATLEALRRLILRETQVQPVVLVFEDLHWIDSETQALLDALVETLASARLLMAVNYRPEYRHGWGQKTFYRQLPIEPLAATVAEELLRPLLGEDASVQPLVATLITRTEGNPLFLEESVRALVADGVLAGEPGRYRLARPLSSIAVPATVQAILAARIDRLGPDDKQLLQAAAVVGKDVPFPLLADVTERSDDELRAGMARLTAQEFVFEAVLFPEVEYTFRHALIHEVAYGGMLAERRRALHARMVAALEGRYADRLPEGAARLAHHAMRGELWDKAARYARQAADRTAAMCVDLEAIEHYRRALDALTRLPATKESVREAIDVRLALRAPLWRRGELEPLLEIFREAEALGTAHGETDRLDAVYSLFVQYYWAKAEYTRALEYGARCIETGRRRGDVGLEVTGHYYVGSSHSLQGRFATALEHYHAIIERLAGRHERERFGLSGQPYSGACALAAQSLVEQGDFDGALKLLEDGDRVVAAANHLYSRVPVAVSRGYLLLHTAAPAEAARAMEPVVAICRENNFAGQTMRALTVLGQAYALDGRSAEAIPLLEEAVALQERAGAFTNRAWWVRTLADAYRRTGRLAEAETTARTAMEFATRSGERPQEAWVEALLGEIARDRRRPDDARTHLSRARTLARELGMRPLALHAEQQLGALG
ncbi:MAG TPA: adenylate/guanylate cyclase domain-containing protein [Methylomirabilota bacterium]|jgi:class 3 adenylate cyclase/tetratricopeptide (TPR) repeat protein